MNTVYIGLGSNIGDREHFITSALEQLRRHCEIIKISSLYETEPVGYQYQGWFLNGVVKVATELNPQELMTELLNIEQSLDRKRLIKNGSRTIDLDILFYNDQIIKEENLIIPHPRLQDRKFVLLPFQDIAIDFMHPVLKKNIKELLASTSAMEEVNLYTKKVSLKTKKIS